MVKGLLGGEFGDLGLVGIMEGRFDGLKIYIVTRPDNIVTGVKGIGAE